MRFFKLLLVVFISFSVFAQYTVVLKNGLQLKVKEKPDFSKQMVEIVKDDGKKLILKTTLIDIEATKEVNKEKNQQKAQSANNLSVKKNTSVDNIVKTTDNKKVFVINEKNFVKFQDKDGKKDTKKKTESRYYSKVSDKEERIVEKYNSDNREEDSDELDNKNGESYWREIFANNKTKLDVAKLNLQKMEERMNQLSSAKIQSTDTMYIMQITKEMNILQEKINKQKQVVDSLQREKQKLLERARREGALPGWYRDYE
jgi:crotonobetainyl-CoA:carnitine CoA-transferase CaiB-like acyl-CoA transferase